MAVRVAGVGVEPVDLAARFSLDPVVTLENLGQAPLWFVRAAAADEEAPADRVGHLLEPGAHEAVEPLGAGFPLWVWSGQAPTLVGVGPRVDG